MEDAQIIALYWQRDETAIEKTQQKYDRYLNKIAYNILLDLSDSEESVNDTYMHAWQSIPPKRPDMLRLYLARICRALSIDRFRRRHSEKRAASEYALSLEELSDCVSGEASPQDEVEFTALTGAIDRYLSALNPKTQSIFICRYYFLDSLKEIAVYSGLTESAVKSLLFRTRQGLKEHLEKEGFTV